MSTPTKYWTLSIPWVPVEFTTQWHPTERYGPFSILCRGAFATQGEAIAWAQEHLHGIPYSLTLNEET